MCIKKPSIFTNNQYLFVCTKSNHIQSKLKDYEYLNIVIEESFHKSKIFFLSSDKKNYYLKVMNDQNDYSISRIYHSIKDGKNPIIDCDTIISYANFIGNYFGAINDYWGILTHFWSIDDSTFVCSNNIYLVANILSQRFSIESIFELLYFYSPLKSRTIFENISRLRPNQSLIFDFAKHSVNLSDPIDQVQDLFSGNQENSNFIETLDNFFINTKKTIGNKGAAIALSSGIDSRTILACLNKHGFNTQAFTFGNMNMVESQLVKMLVENKINWKLVDISDIATKWKERFTLGMAITNGYLNPMRSHYVNFYDSIPNDLAIFEGTCGDEFIRGLVCPDVWISNYHLWAIQGQTLEEIVENHFKIFKKQFRDDLKSYIADFHSEDLKHIETPEGLKKYQSFDLEFITAFYYASPFLLALENHDVYIPFLSKKFLKTIFSDKKHSLSKTVNIRNDFPKGILMMKVESEIVKHADEELYNTILSYGYSFKEILEGIDIFTRIKGKVRRYLIQQKYKKLYKGQIDNSKIKELVLKYCDNNLPNSISSNLSENFSIKDLQKHAQRLSMLKVMEDIVSTQM